jgi:hypothetical protein
MEKIQKPSTKFQTISIHNLGSIFRKSQLKNAAIILEFGAWNLPRRDHFVGNSGLGIRVTDLEAG